MAAILECTNLNKSYGNLHAVCNLTLKLEENTIYGLLGRNGAGKTTILNMVTGSIFPDSGAIKVAGTSLLPGDIPENTCYVREKNYFFGGAKITEILELASTFHPNWDWEFARKLLHAFKLNPNKKMRQLSKGMVTMVGNIIGLASRSPLTIYDEPVLGLDVLMREKFYRLLVEDYTENPRTILFSTHLIDEIATIVEKNIIIKAGDILMNEDVETIRQNSHLLMGSKDAVEQFTADKRVLHMEGFEKNTICAIYGKMDVQARVDAKKIGINVEGLPLQKFFAYLIEGGDHVE